MNISNLPNWAFYMLSAALICFGVWLGVKQYQHNERVTKCFPIELVGHDYIDCPDTIIHIKTCRRCSNEH